MEAGRIWLEFYRKRGFWFGPHDDGVLVSPVNELSPEDLRLLNRLMPLLRQALLAEKAGEVLGNTVRSLD